MAQLHATTAPHVLYNRALKIKQIKQKNAVIQTAVSIFSMSHCAISPGLHHEDELHPDLVVIPMNENMQTDKEPLSFRAGRFRV